VLFFPTRCPFLEDSACKTAHLLVVKCSFNDKIFNFYNSFGVFFILEDRKFCLINTVFHWS
jgi:hypothetical protein